MGKGWRAATRSEYRKVEELTLAGFFVITLLASTISGVEVPSLRRAPLRRPLAGSAKVVKRKVFAKASQALFYKSRESIRDAGSLSFARRVRAKGVRTKSVKMDQVLHVSEYLRGIYDFAVQYFHASCDFRALLSRASLTFAIPRDRSPEDIGTFALGRGRSRFKPRPTTHGDYSTFMQMSVAFSYKYLMRPTKIAREKERGFAKSFRLKANTSRIRHSRQTIPSEHRRAVCITTSIPLNPRGKKFSNISKLKGNMLIAGKR
ncbi:hypothetical protein ALC56_06123 [Trachymyrmex septentrionalis]|uniref:Uncharacterized protein n=1 Tax=Trachymyrmex septentrionalis TaxID=34720 RepID=A0A195FI14_9HYME|nr:hypothetical protein ALC56_06123 [Trachymyrmex septentrionalis]